MQGGDPDGMDELYESPKQGSTQTVDDQEREQMDQTAAVPLKVLQGKHPDAPKAGDEIVVKVKEINGDMAIIAYSETPASSIGEGEGGGEGDYQSADDELDQLGKQY